jgi:hypothetical protein
MSMKMEQELAKVNRRVKAFDDGPRAFERILLHPPLPTDVLHGIFKTARSRLHTETKMLRGDIVNPGDKKMRKEEKRLSTV